MGTRLLVARDSNGRSRLEEEAKAATRPEAMLPAFAVAEGSYGRYDDGPGDLVYGVTKRCEPEANAAETHGKQLFQQQLEGWPRLTRNRARCYFHRHSLTFDNLMRMSSQ